MSTIRQKQMTGAIIPIFEIRRDDQTARRVGRESLLGILRSLRNSEMGKVCYNRIRDLLYLACGEETVAPRLGSLEGSRLGNST